MSFLCLSYTYVLYLSRSLTLVMTTRAIEPLLFKTLKYGLVNLLAFSLNLQSAFLLWMLMLL